MSRVRLLAVCSAALFFAIALVIRALDDGALEQVSGTALYGSMMYAAVLFFRPRISGPVAGIVATGLCWAIELSQLTGIPAYLSARSVLARLALGVQFDPVDLAWYPAGIVPLAVAHTIAIRRSVWPSPG
ncbi:DUF2809 domain-containing protein [Longispora albida]|uniref:ribosomal maturation YjgA family protein n=1 Tax=Longispora albida TaxID=203523 RepID=UPI000365D04F|nr:DUF2809 domain-containing protein [Longispora albida]